MKLKEYEAIKKAQKQNRTTAAKLKANAKYLAKQREIKIRLDPEKDAELIEWLDSKKSKQGYIKALIRENMDVVRMMNEIERKLAEKEEKEEEEEDPEEDYYRDLEEEREEKEREEEEREKALRQDAMITELMEEVLREQAAESPAICRASTVWPWEDPEEDPMNIPLYDKVPDELIYDIDAMLDPEVREDMAKEFLAGQNV